MTQNRQNTMREISQIIIDASSKQRKAFREENMILELCCKFFDAQPRVIAEQYNALVKDSNKTGNDVIRIFRVCKLDRIAERIELLKRSNDNAQKILKAIDQGNSSFIQNIQLGLNSHVQARRLTLIAFGAACKSELSDNAYDYLLRLNRDFANECLDTILALIEEQGDNAKTDDQQTSLTPEAYKEEIYRLTTALNRSNNLVQRLQDSYEEQVKEIQASESIRLISMLNSEKYGYVLDLLVSAKKGFQLLRTKGSIPLEIKSVQSLIWRLMEFVEDCGIMPMREVGEQFTIEANEADKYSYEGVPFTSLDEKKRVEVISSGWIASEKDVIISYPRVKEITEEA